MRIPLLIAIPVCIFSVAAIWWASTRKMDFLSPPSKARLEQIRKDTLSALPISKMEEAAISIEIPLPETDPTLPAPVEIEEPLDLGDITSPPMLDTYSERAPEGAAKLLVFASELENAGAFQRALLANERVLDLAQSTPEEIQSAISALQRIRPSLSLWNAAAEKALPVTIHVGTGQKFAKILPEILESITRDLSLASSGLIKFSYKLNIGKSIQANDAPTPVALWITGPEKDSPSTDVLSFTTEDADTLKQDQLKTVFNLVRSHLSKSTAYNPPPEALEDPVPALNSHITRLLWQEFADLLNPAKPD